MKRIALIILSLIYINCFGQQYSKSWKDVNYAGDSLRYHLLDIYLPANEKPSYPVVVVIYGSAWFANDMKGSVLGNLGKALLGSGYAVVAPNHRSSIDAKFQAQINDIKAVVRFVRANVAKYQFGSSFVAYITQTVDDKLVDVDNSIVYFEQLRKHNVLVEMLIYPKGGHGFIFGHTGWMEPLLQWIKDTKLIDK